MMALTAFIFVGIGTYAMRASMIAAACRVRMPSPLSRVLDHVTPSVFAAIAIPGIVVSEGQVAVVSSNTVAALATAAVAWRRMGVGPALLVGIIVHLLVGAVQ